MRRRLYGPSSLYAKHADLLLNFVNSTQFKSYCKTNSDRKLENMQKRKEKKINKQPKQNRVCQRNRECQGVSLIF